MSQGLQSRSELIGNFEAKEPLPETSWTVLTGGTTCGKTTVGGHVESFGYPVADEMHRAVIEELSMLHSGGKSDGAEHSFGDFRTQNEKSIRGTILEVTSWFETSLLDFRDVPLVLDRAVPDQLSWFGWSGMDEKLVLGKQSGKYRNVARLALLPFIADGIRINNESRRRFIHELLRFDYESLGYEVHEIDSATPQARAEELRERLPEPPSKPELDEVRHAMAEKATEARQYVRDLWTPGS